MSDKETPNVEALYLERFSKRYKKGNWFKFIDADDVQVKWGNNDDPRLLLEKGKIYKVESIEKHSYHTKLTFVGIEGKFNSASFEWIDHMSFAGRAEIGTQMLKEQRPITIEIAREQSRMIESRRSATYKKQRSD